MRPHVNRDLVFAIRERDRVYPLANLYPENNVIMNLYQQLIDYIELHNRRLRADYEFNRIQAPAGDSRKQWKIYKEVLFNRTGSKRRDECITIDEVSMTGSVNACNVINERFCTAG